MRRVTGLPEFIAMADDVERPLWRTQQEPP
ncbi:hypothetical protein BJ123_1227 [Rhodopseudomonas thermotolerans]|jgi:hypothetical protein|uniref:Uncharacterized protein n=2 Tax=Rhodopseudomonas TaxID=1073 RepID=A0A336K352_9BRAD|nr:hypothetical protein BJ125_1227 [Rhodopseudomonas pentothenatexigens]REF91400.1 hypothetical protein BJ123_1227 [Rhodopseudomonas thermotolerans]SSW92581.1 hypothetical protein SAMN05892882_1227 [Rhodopseudomonas pentothenatexigens]